MDIYPDLALVDTYIDDAWRQRGWIYEKDGVEHRNSGAARHFVAEVVAKNYVVEVDADLGPKSFTKSELYRVVFPDGPGARTQPATLEERKARDALQTYVWGLTSVGTDGHVQRQLAPLGLVLCEAQVPRTRTSRERPHDIGPDTDLGRFATSNGDLILKYFTARQGLAFQRAAQRLEKSLSMVVDRQPELLIPVAKQLQTMVRAAIAQIPHGDAKTAAALQPGVGSDEPEVA